MLVVIDNQCTGQESSQGEQDNDVTNAAPGHRHCHRATTVRAAELEVLSDRPEVIGAVAED